VTGLVARVFVVLVGVASVTSAGPYASDARRAHLARAIDAIRALGGDGRRAFERELHEATRVRCRPTAHPATTTCAIEVARTTCAGKPDPAGCLAAADLVLTHQHAEHDLVDERTRVRLVRSSSDYHAAILDELRAQFALLAAELALAMPDPGGAPGDPVTAASQLAALVDRFCVERDREVHRCAPGAKGCVPGLPWQRCAAGLVWYIAEASP
jgi:hypothetical protein